MTLFDLSMTMYEVKKITVHECVHDNETGHEHFEVETFENNVIDMTWTRQQAKVMMFTPTKKGCVDVWTYREV